MLICYICSQNKKVIIKRKRGKNYVLGGKRKKRTKKVTKKAQL